MAKKETITIEKKTIRVPVPQKPPKVEESKKRKYDRKKEKKIEEI